MSKTRIVSQDIGDGTVLPADLDVSADNTTADSTTGHHGLLPKLGGGSTNYLRADGTWNTPPGTGSVSVATDPIWDAAGDLAVGTGADTAAKLTKGADSTVLTIDPTTHLPVWTAPSSGSLTGWAPLGMWPGADILDYSNASQALAAVSASLGGAVAMPVWVGAPMLLQSYSLWQTATANLRTAEIRLYADLLNNSTNLAFVAGTDSTFSFTPTVAAKFTSAAVSGAPVLLAPGWYWVVLRNTSTAQTFSLGSSGAATNTNLFTAVCMLNLAASIAALGSTIDISGWSTSARKLPFKLNGRVMGQSTALLA